MNIDDKKLLSQLEDIPPYLEQEQTDDSDEALVNRRLAVRYLRDDIIVVVKQFSLFKWRILPQVQLIDISSKGAYICSSTKLQLKNKLLMVFAFEDGKQFRAHGKIIYNNPKETYCYGIKFDQFEHALGDHLVKSQRQLIFK